MRAHHISIDPPAARRVAPTADPLGKPAEASSRRPHIARSLIALMMVTTLCTPALAQWKWLDANGNAQYSDRPPPAGTPDSKVLLRPNAVARPTAAPTPSASTASAPMLATTDPELEAKRKKAESDAKQEAAAKAQVEADRVARAKAENCARARSQAATLNDGIRIARVNEKGEREYLDDNQRAQETSRAQSIMASDCK